MRLYLFVLLFFLSTLYAKDKEICQMEFELSAECEPLTTVADCVNVLSGQFFQVEEDLVSNTIDPLYIQRTYDSGSLIESFLGFSFGSQFPLIATSCQKGSKHSYALISERDGFLIPYQSANKEDVYRIDARLFEKGYTNLNLAEKSGHANLINWRSSFKPKKGEYWKVYLGNGTTRTYGATFKLSSLAKDQINLPTKTLYLLTEETKPNGNKLKFHYNLKGEYPLLTQIQTVNHIGEVINSLHFIYTPYECQVKSSCGSFVTYAYREQLAKIAGAGIKRKILSRVYSSQRAPLCYEYPCKAHLAHCQLEKVEVPQGKSIDVHYEKGKVKSLHEPLGLNGEMITSYTFQYEKNCTKVLDAHSQLTEYHFDKNKRLSFRRYFDRGQCIRQDCFEWDPKGWLQKKTIQQNGHTVLSSTYSYDKKGNVICQTFTGDNCSYTIEYSYSQDDLNLLLSKKTAPGLLIFYSYLPGTQLCTKELHSYEGKIQERIFRFYDQNGQLQGILEDDGSSQEHTDLTDVTYRKETFTYTVKEAGPSFGKPSQVFEKYLDPASCQMVEQNRADYLYDAFGNEVCQKVYDAQGNFCYETCKEYDHRLRVIFEKDALGDCTHYQYHDNNKVSRKETEGKAVTFLYDKADRLIRKEEHYANGDLFVTQYRYNRLNQCIAEIDPYGHKTSYTYDRFGHVTQIKYPAQELHTGDLKRPTITRTYNVLGQKISETNENGYTTHFFYTALGKLTQIMHPDGSMERYEYRPSGFLKQKWEADGSSISYTQDAKGRILSKTFRDENGHFLKEESFRYKGDLLVYKKDPMGVETFYHYDGAGRKIEERTLNRTTYTSYDSFNRPVEIREEQQKKIFQYDFKDQILSKTLLDLNGTVYAKTNFAYDCDGHLVQKSTAKTHDESATYHTHYERNGLLSSSQDPLGHQKLWVHHHHHKNGHNQKVRSHEIYDPLGREVREVEDTFHRTVKREICENGQPISTTLFHYDPLGNLVKETHEGKDVSKYTVNWKYNRHGQIAFEMVQGIKTSFVYDSKNRLIKKVKPDNVALHYKYDALDRLVKLTSSDGTIDYAFTYDLHDNPIEVQDLVHNRMQKRRYDSFSQLFEEELSPGNVLHYQYDALGRLVELTLPDHSTIQYAYDPFHLRTIQRPNYSISCSAYDLAGNLLKIENPAGSITYTYDLLGRTISIQSSSWASFQEAFDSCGNLLALKQKDPHGEHLEHFAYDRFNHLTQEGSQEYKYDALGNCLKKGQIPQVINALNQITHDGNAPLSYDPNGNLLSIGSHTTFTYDALNRLTCMTHEGKATTFLYDAFNRCLQITTPHETKQLLYQHDKEIGSIQNGKLKEFRLIHPEQELTFAIEQEGQALFPVQDQQYNICALYASNGALSQWTRYTAFGNKITFGDAFTIPWSFANRREIDGHFLFTDRLYSPHLMRWLTQDPVRFQDGLNLYTYNHNNPLRFADPHGRIAIVIPLIAFKFGVEALVFAGVLSASFTAVALGKAALAFGICSLLVAGEKIVDQYENRYNQIQTSEEEEEKKDTQEKTQDGVKKKQKKYEVYAPDRPLPKNEDGVLTPETDAPHTQLGMKKGRRVKYPQAREFDQDGEIVRDIDFTDHGRPHEHKNPHQHIRIDNETGGTKKRDVEEPLPGWRYE